ncbi:N-lysine methyltransferase KMT5A-A [Dissostichus eleginoides]|uniref:[histone H4]-lysine(20) N-methyltransferase n=1 Tax=Dissostichus eleginoides TaxID=100907 RepID=A0AAD9C2X3_DISEL|nr:N-lysine methyltransferase KMT5A-A [Dissostichus eleginoides]
MAKGKQGVLRTDKNTKNTVENKVPSRGETKENKPATNKTSVGEVQTNFLSVRSPSKPRSPLSDSSTMLIQEGNDCGASHPDVPKSKKEVPNEIKSESCESKEQKAEIGCKSHGIKEQATEQLEKKKSTAHTNGRSAAEIQVLAAKPRSKTGRKPAAKKSENQAPQNRKVTDYYPIRRSNRKTKAEIKSEEHKHLDYLIKNDIEEGLQIKHIEGKGRGIFAATGFKKAEFIVEYHGDLLQLAEAKEREAKYALDPQKGCYMYYFQYHTKTYCVDATEETGRLGRLINHSKNGNCQTRLHAIDGSPHLILVASREIKAEEELLYDYGDRSKASVLAHPWLKY